MLSTYKKEHELKIKNVTEELFVDSIYIITSFNGYL